MAKLFFLFSCVFILCSNAFSDTKFISNVKIDSVMVDDSGRVMVALAWDDRSKLEGRCDYYGYDFLLDYIPKDQTLKKKVLKGGEAKLIRTGAARAKIYELIISARVNGMAVDIWYKEKAGDSPYNCASKGRMFVVESLAI